MEEVKGSTLPWRPSFRRRIQIKSLGADELDDTAGVVILPVLLGLAVITLRHPAADGATGDWEFGSSEQKAASLCAFSVLCFACLDDDEIREGVEEEEGIRS